MLSKADVQRLASEAGLTGADHERAIRNVRPGWRLIAAEGPSRSHIGGQPDLAPDEEWPTDDDGIPFTFIAQIDCRDLSPLPAPWDEELAWPHGGQLLRIFAALIAEPFTYAEAAVLTCDPAVSTQPTARPPVPDPYPRHARNADAEDEQRIFELPGTGVTFVPTLNGSHISLPPDHAEREQLRIFDHRLRYDGAPEPDYYEPDTWDRDRPWYQSHLAGCAYPTHDDARYGREPDPEDWTTLLAIGDGDHDGPTLGLGEITAIQLYLPKEDLARGKYDRIFSDTPMS
jgi:hypothetical protein